MKKNWESMERNSLNNSWKIFFDEFAKKFMKTSWKNFGRIYGGIFWRVMRGIPDRNGKGVHWRAPKEINKGNFWKKYTNYFGGLPGEIPEEIHGIIRENSSNNFWKFSRRRCLKNSWKSSWRKYSKSLWMNSGRYFLVNF